VSEATPPALLAVTNAAAGSAADSAVSAALRVLRDGADLEVVRTEAPADLDSVVGDLGGRRLVVVGGDGSLHAVVAALQRRGLLDGTPPVLGLVPLGTGNDLARSAGLPLDPTAAARAVLHGSPQPMELLLDDAGGVVVNAVHIGVGAEAGQEANRWKPRIGAAAYAVGSVIAGSRTRGWRLRVEVDGTPIVDFDRRVLMVGLGLGSSIGGGSLLAPDATPEDGLVDVVISAAVGPVARAAYALRLRRGEHIRRRDVRVVRAKRVRVFGQPFPYNADGEVGGPVRSRSWSVRPGAWRLLVPVSG
jgi:YegS/Rv2252/BmrU family lipid kinase